MRICMILHDPQDFGGLEEYAATLAISLRQQGQQVSVLSTTWVPKHNQYVQRLLANGVTYVQVPKWLSRPASHWPTKQKILQGILWLAIPLIFFLALGLMIVKHKGWRKSWASARSWLGGEIQTRFIAPNGYKNLTILLLNWWRFCWRPELFHIQGYTSSLLFVIEWAYRKKIPVVYEEHQTPDARFDWWQGFDQSINKATTVVAVSDKSADALRDVCGVIRPIVVRNPLLPDPLVSNTDGMDGSNNPGQCLQVTTVARLVEAKGLDYLLDAIAKVQRRYPNVQFRCYGEGPLRSDLLDRASKLGLEGDVIFPGAFSSRDELSVIMKKTDIFLMSSILEGQPLAVVEAMAYGCPIVTTSVGGIPELIQNGVNGLLCPPRDPDCLAEKVCSLIENPSLRAKLGEAARRSYRMSPFQPVSVSNHFVTIYQEALMKGTPV